MDRVRLLAAFTHGGLVFSLYMIAWGAPAPEIAMLEVTLAVGAAVSTWYALRGWNRSRA